ncbi:MAG: hypothetical protein JKY56_21945 [Kofleriaceae bacterium]|nr:hypothetical protein [Kofleriaceae bacterium]
MGNWIEQGTVDIVLQGFEDASSPLDFQIATFSTDGYPSIEVSVSADSQGEDEPGCSTSGSGGLHLGFPLLFLLAGFGLRTRRQLRSER